MFLRKARQRVAVLVAAVCLSGLGIESSKAITFSYYSHSSANFDSQTPGGFALSGTWSYSTVTKSAAGYSLNLSGRAGEAKASQSFSEVSPPFRVSFEVNVRLHENSSLPLEFACVKLGSSPFVEVRLLRTGSGKLGVAVNSTTVSETSKVVGLGSWQSIVLVYDPSSPKIEVSANGSQAYSHPGPNSYLNGSLAVSFGVMAVSSGRSTGEVLFDSFDLSLSPISEAERPVCSPGDEVFIRGCQFTPASDVEVVVKDPSGKTVKTLAAQSDPSGHFRVGMNLSASAASGKYEISAKDPSRGTVKSSFGVWSCSKAKVQRAEMFSFSGGGLRGATAVTITIYKGSLQVKKLSLSASGAGSFSAETELPPDAQEGTYFAVLSGTGTADYPARPFSDSLSFEVTPATLNVIVQTNKPVYNRTQTMSVTVQVTYPDGSQVASSSQVQLRLYFRQTLVTPAALMAYSSASKRWVWSYAFSSSARIGNYTIAVSASDAYGNSGSANSSVKVEPATLSIAIQGLKESYQRTESINLSASINYPDGSAVTSGSFKMRLRAQTGTVREAPLVYDQYAGRWRAAGDEPYRIPVDEATGTWTLAVLGNDYSENYGEKSSTITIQRATISILEASLNSSYPRTSRIALRVKPTYPSGSTLVSGTVFATLSTSSGREYLFPLSLEPGEDAWAGVAVIGRDCPLGVATLNLTASDRYQNSGSWAGGFNVTLAVLKVSIQAERNEIQIGFDSLRLVGNVTYPDGSPLTDGTVSASITAGNAVLKNLNLTYHEGVGWTGTYSPSVFDPSGLYAVSVTAVDAYGNGGRTFFQVNALQTLLFGVIVLILLSVTVGTVLWFRSRRRSAPSSLPPIPELGS